MSSFASPGLFAPFGGRRRELTRDPCMGVQEIKHGIVCNIVCHTPAAVLGLGAATQRSGWPREIGYTLSNIKTAGSRTSWHFTLGPKHSHAQWRRNWAILRFVCVDLRETVRSRALTPRRIVSRPRSTAGPSRESAGPLWVLTDPPRRQPGSLGYRKGHLAGRASSARA